MAADEGTEARPRIANHLTEDSGGAGRTRTSIFTFNCDALPIELQPLSLLRSSTSIVKKIPPTAKFG